MGAFMQKENCSMPKVSTLNYWWGIQITFIEDRYIGIMILGFALISTHYSVVWNAYKK